MKIIRWFSVYPLKLLLYTNISANQLSMAWMLLGLIAGVFLIKGDYWWSLSGMILYQFAYLIDQLDEPVARYKKQTNLGGEYLDEHTKYLHRTALLAFMSIGAFNKFQNPIYIYAGLISVLFILMDQIMRLKPFHIYSLNNKFKELKKISKISIERQKNRFIVYVIEFFRPQAFNAMLFAAIFDVLHYLLIFYAIMLPIGYLKTVISGYKETARFKN